MNIFGENVPGDDDASELDSMNIVPCWIDDTFVDGVEDYKGFLPFVQLNSTDNKAASGNTYTHGRRPNAVTVEESETVKSWLSSTLEKGSKDNAALFSNIQVGFWFGDFDKFTPQMPHPFCDRFEILTDYSKNNMGYWTGKGWRLVDSGHDASLRIKSGTVGLGKLLARLPKIDSRKKYEFSFLSNSLPDVRATFFIRGKKYICSQIKADVDENGMSLLKKGTFFRILEG